MATVSVRAVGRAVFGIFLDLDFDDPCPTAGVFADHRVEDAIQMPGEAFAGAVRQGVDLEQVAGSRQQALGFRVVFVKEAGVVEVLIDPGFEILELTEIHDEAVLVGLAAGEGQRNRPVMPVDEGAVAVMAVLAMGEWYIAVGFFAGNHGRRGLGI